eukprot:2896752-Alexandrium_andersonii.AAC.1
MPCPQKLLGEKPMSMSPLRQAREDGSTATRCAKASALAQRSRSGGFNARRGRPRTVPRTSPKSRSLRACPDSSKRRCARCVLPQYWVLASLPGTW